MLIPLRVKRVGEFMKTGTKRFHPPVYWVHLGVCDSMTLWLCHSVTLWPITTQTRTIHRGALRFATQISPLLNLFIETYKPCTLVGPTVTRQVLDPLAVLFLNNRLYMQTPLMCLYHKSGWGAWWHDWFKTINSFFLGKACKIYNITIPDKGRILKARPANPRTWAFSVLK